MTKNAKQETVEQPTKEIGSTALAAYIYEHVHVVDQYTSQLVADAVLHAFNVAKKC